METDRTQALVGFVKANHKALRNLAAEITNNFASIVVSSMEAKPIARSGKLLLTTGSRVANTNMKWNEARTRAQGGESPSLIEPVARTIVLRNLAGAKAVTAVALDGSGSPVGASIQARKTADGWALPVGDPVTPWYVITVGRR